MTITPPNADTPGEDEEDLMAEWDAMASDGDDGSDEADSMASEWEAMLGGDDDDDMGSIGGGRESTRVLNQD